METHDSKIVEQLGKGLFCPQKAFVSMKFM